jgi:hypothetical protein
MRAGSLWAAGFASFHLYIIVCGAGGIPTGPNNWLGRVLEGYGAWTGVEIDYAFYAPDISDVVVTRVTCVTTSGQVSTYGVGNTPAEVDVRLNSMSDLMYASQNLDLEARALSAYVLGRIPDSCSATVQVYHHWLPTMAAYRNGERAALEEFYRAEFVRRDQ